MSPFEYTGPLVEPAAPTPRDRSVCSAAAQGERCPMATPPLAIDVSHYQGAIDWRAVATWAGPGGFAYQKLTEGADAKHDDPTAARNLAAMRAERLRAGVYHFARFLDVEQAEREAAHFLGTYEPLHDPSDIAPALDLEVPATGRVDLGAAALAWLDRVASVLGTAPLVYVSPDFAHRCLASAPRLAKFPLWVAHYHVEKPAPCPPWPDDAWVMWQYGRAPVPGIAAPVDVNRVRVVPL